MRAFLTVMMLTATAAMAAPREVGVSADGPQSTSAATTAAAGQTELKIVAFGDSLTSGHRLPERDSYPAVLEQTLREAGLPFSVSNHGVNGDTTAGGVRRLAAALAERPQILIVAFGANDGLRGVPVAQVRSNLEQIIEGAQAAGARILLVGMEALPLYGWQYTVDFHHIFPELAAKYNIPLVPFMLNGVLGNRDLMSRDGIHPNAAGARLIAENVWTELRPLAESLITAATN
jgi:acyl-CoA thioesterase-1